MPPVTLVGKFLVSILIIVGGLYWLATLTPNLNNIFGPLVLVFIYGPVYLFETLGLPVLNHTDIFGVINPLGWVVLIIFYLLVAYGLAWIWSKVKSKQEGI